MSQKRWTVEFKYDHSKDNWTMDYDIPGSFNSADLANAYADDLHSRFPDMYIRVRRTDKSTAPIRWYATNPEVMNDLYKAFKL